MTVSLRLQEIFPEPNPEQKGLIDASTLCMSRVEKTCIDAINEGWEAYRVDHAIDEEERRELSDRYITIVSDAKIKGIAVSVIGGAVAGGYAGGIYTAGNIGGVAVGAAIGGGGGYYAGSKIGLKIGRARAEATVTQDPRYRNWKTDKYRVALPALIRSMTIQEREPFDLECPITLQFMEHPVFATDGHYYEAESVRELLRRHKPSPFRAGRIHAVLRPKYYDELYPRMKAIYNGKIGELHLSLQGHAPVRSEVEPIVRFYQRPLGARIRLIRDTEDVVLESGIPEAEQQEITDLFAEARAHPPSLL